MAEEIPTIVSDELLSSLGNLRLSFENGKNFTTDLDLLIKSLDLSDDKVKFCDTVVDDALLASLTKILQTGEIKDKTKVAELIAELAKIEKWRLSCVFSGIVPSIVDLLESDSLNANIQACRSLGNVCYEHDGGRICVTGCGALKKLISLMHRIVKLPKTEEIHQLKLISTGFLLNILNSYEIVKKHPEHLDIVNVLGVYINECINEDDIITHVMLSVSCIVDEDKEQCEIIVNHFTPNLVKVLTESSSIEVLESCLDLLSSIAENDGFKTKLAEQGVAEAVVNIVKKFKHSRDQEAVHGMVKVACDLVVHMIASDQSVNSLYDNGKSAVYKELLEWLSSDCTSLQVAGFLAIGNFARSDENCIQMVESGISSLLLEVLARNATNEHDMRLQHSVLAALRNLAISRVNKPILIDQGCLDILLNMVVSIEAYPIVFKLLGTLRMIVDNQSVTVNRICGSNEILKKLVEWTNVSNCPGVQAESSRILAWLVLSSESSFSILENYITTGALASIVNMLESEHQVLQWEASSSLKKLICGNINSAVVNVLQESNFTEKCILLMKKPERNSLSNTFSIMQSLSETECGLQLLKNQTFAVALEEWSTNSYDSNVCPDKNLLTSILV